jgi:hypothetical protein
VSDPLAAIVSRALGRELGEVTSERLGAAGGVDRERVRFRDGGRARSLVFERLAPRNALEAQLVPFLARKTAHAPAVHARGIPRPVTPAPPWLLVEDLEGAPSACDGDPALIVEAKIAIERPFPLPCPALRALGVPERPPALIAEEIARAAPEAADEAREAARRLRKWPVALVHGDLRCANAVVTERGVVIARWGSAHLGCALLDVVRLVADVVGRDDAVRGIGLSRMYAERLDAVLPTEVLRGAEKLDRLARRHLDPARGG